MLSAKTSRAKYYKKCTKAAGSAWFGLLFQLCAVIASDIAARATATAWTYQSWWLLFEKENKTVKTHVWENQN